MSILFTDIAPFSACCGVFSQWFVLKPLMNDNLIRTIDGGYSLLTATQVTKVLYALINKRISFYAFRTYCACLEMREMRKAFYTSQPKHTVQGRYACYSAEEIKQLLGARSTRLISSAVRTLEGQELLSVKDKSMQISKDTSLEVQGLLEACHMGRTPNRKIPIPRRMLRFLARCTQVSVAKTLLFYCLRGLSLKRGGVIQAKGTMKSSLLAHLGKCSLRAISAARKILISLRLITPDETRCQRKLNRTGVFFTINLQWKPNASCSDDKAKVCTDSAPPSPAQDSNPACPIKRFRTSYEGRNQKLCSRTASGVSQKKKSDTPSLSQVVPKDLGNLSRLQELYRQAIKRQWIKRSEASWIAWVAAAVRAQRLGTEQQGIKLFVAIIRQRLYDHISQAEEDEARRLIHQHRDAAPQGVSQLLHQVLTALRGETGSGERPTLWPSLQLPTPSSSPPVRLPRDSVHRGSKDC